MAKGGEFILPSEKLPSIFTVNDLTEEQKMIQETIREFMGSNVLPYNHDIESKGLARDFIATKTALSQLGELGFLGAEIPIEYGGQGLDKVTGAIIAEEVSLQGSFATTLLAHTGIGTMPIRFFGTEDQKKKYLPKLVSGEWIVSYCLTEVGSGSDVESIKTTASFSEDGNFYLLNGEKIFVTNGGFSNIYVVFAKLDGRPTAFIVERNAPGFLVGNEEHKMGIQGSSTVTLVLNNAQVPKENILGNPGDGKKIALNILNLGRFKLAAACLGAGKVCLKESLQRARDRKQFGKQISEFGAIRQKLAEMAVRVYAMESVVYRTAGHLEEAIGKVDSNDSKAILKAIEEFAIECSIVKVACSEMLDFIVDENVQIHGGMGFCEGNPERHYRDSRINRIFEGTNEINRLLAVGMLLKKSLTGGLPLLSAIKKIQGETIGVSSEGDKTFNDYLNNIRKAVLLVAGAAYQKYNVKLEEHQIVLMALSDCLINIYVLESVIAAAKTQEHYNYVSLILLDSLFKIEQLTRELAAMSLEGDELRMVLGILKKFLKFTPNNKEELYEKIVGHLLQGA